MGLVTMATQKYDKIACLWC